MFFLKSKNAFPFVSLQSGPALYFWERPLFWGQIPRRIARRMSQGQVTTSQVGAKTLPNTGDEGNLLPLVGMLMSGLGLVAKGRRKED